MAEALASFSHTAMDQEMIRRRKVLAGAYAIVAADIAGAETATIGAEP